MFTRLLAPALLFLSLSGCAVHDYDRGYHGGHVHRYYDGYRHNDYPPPRYDVETRRYHYYRAPPRYVPAPPRHHYGYDRRHRDGYKHPPPRHDHRREQRRQEHRGGQMLRGWDAGRNTQHRFSSGRSHSEQRRSGERRW